MVLGVFLVVLVGVGLTLGKSKTAVKTAPVSPVKTVENSPICSTFNDNGKSLDCGLFGYGERNPSFKLIGKVEKLYETGTIAVASLKVKNVYSEVKVIDVQLGGDLGWMGVVSYPTNDMSVWDKTVQAEYQILSTNDFKTIQGKMPEGGEIVVAMPITEKAGKCIDGNKELLSWLRGEVNDLTPKEGCPYRATQSYLGSEK
jgi:hypothetical protein